MLDPATQTAIPAAVRLMRILVATDFSPAAAQAGEVAARLAEALAVPLEVLHVIQEPPYSSPEVASRLTGAMRDAAEAELARVVDGLGGRRCPISSRVEFGAIDEVVGARAAEPGTLLVIGQHGRKGFARFLGSTVERTVRAAVGPVLVVPETPGALARWLPSARPLRITAGVDDSPASATLAEVVRALAARTPCAVDLVHVFWPPREHARLGLPGQGQPGVEDLKMDGVLLRELRARVGHIPTAPAHEARLRLYPHWGQEDEPLLVAAQGHHADLIVLGLNRRDRRGTALTTLRASELPVLCVPAEEPLAHALASTLPPVRRVLVAYDFSPLAALALPHAIRLAGQDGRVLVVHVADPRPLGLAPEVRADLEQDLAAAVGAAERPPGLVLETRVEEGRDPAEAIVTCARREGSDLVVLASHGRTGIAHALLGSVARAVLTASPVPTVVVPAR